MNSIVRYILAVAFFLMLVLPAAAKDRFNPAELTPVDRTVIGDDIVHYTFEVKVDRGPYGRIRLHRFIREPEPYQPIPDAKGILLLPGSPATIMGIYAASLFSEHVPWDHSILIYLAKNNLDVWGMDYAWALVPTGRKNFNFMRDWTIVKDARHAEAALSFVRTTRGSTGQGTGTLILLGHSWGVTIGYAVLSEESQKPENERNVGAFIPVDNAMKYSADYSTYRESACADADLFQAMWDSGIYADNGGLGIDSLAALTESDPEGPSDIISGFTNYQAFLYLFADPTLVVWRLFGGHFNEDGVPTGLRFTDPQFAIEALQGFSPYWPVKAEWEELALQCDEVDVPGFEHIDQITVPILYVGGASGWGQSGYYTLTLTQSNDIAQFTMQLLPDEERVFDFGHADLISATDAETLVWQPILNWINAH